MSFVAVAAPLHGPSATRHPLQLRGALHHFRGASRGLTEAYGRGSRAAIASMRKTRVVCESGGKDRRRGQYDNPILVPQAFRSLGSGQLFGADASHPARIAPERWDTFSAVDTADGPVCHINLHPHAGIQDQHGRLKVDTDRGRKAAEQFQGLDRFLDLCDALAWEVVVTGDLNFRDRGGDHASPYRVLRDHGLQVHSHGIVALAASPGLDMRVTLHQATHNITDHPWLVGTSR